MGPFSLFSAQSNHASPLLVHQTLTDGDFPFGQDPLGQNEGPTTLSGEDGYSASICEDGTASLNIESSLHSPERAMLDHSKPTTWPTTSLSPAGQSQFSLDHDDHSSWRLPDEGQVIRALEDREREEQIEEANFQIFDLQPPAKRRRLLSPHKHELSMPLYQDQHTSMLLHHYMNHVADLLQPILHPRNPWRTIYFPFALQGCPELFLAQNPTPSSRASISLFHSLLSSAAFHLNNATNTSPIFRTLGIRHRIKALRALKSIPIHAINQELYTEYLTAMLALVTIDVCIPIPT
jgi:Fungal specific transcription factor domain